MKHNLKITSLLLVMFLITQLIGLAVIYADPLKIEKVVDGQVEKITNPYLKWMDVPSPETDREFTSILFQMLISFIIAVSLLLFLMKFKIELLLKAWFFVVIVIALFLSIIAFEKLVPFMIPFHTAMIAAFILALFLAYMKMFQRNILIHNLTEFLIYPGLAVIFVPILNLFTLILLLILISVYDMWAVWRSGIMQKMAKYQIKKLRVFSGFFVPYAPNAKIKKQIQEAKKAQKKGKKIKYKKIKINVAILGGGDVIFPIIASGVVLKTAGILSAIFVILGATLGLGYLFFSAEKKKFYPAMPFITAGILSAIFLSWIIL